MAFANSIGHSGRSAGIVRISQVIDDKTPPVMRYEPGHPDADKDGYVAYPAINPVQEMVDLMGSTRAYQLNASCGHRSKTNDPTVYRHLEELSSALKNKRRI